MPHYYALDDGGHVICDSQTHRFTTLPHRPDVSHPCYAHLHRGKWRERWGASKRQATLLRGQG